MGRRRRPDEEPVRRPLPRADRIDWAGRWRVVSLGYAATGSTRYGARDARVYVNASRGLSEVAKASVSLEDFNFAHHIALVRIRPIQGPMAVDEEPPVELDARHLLTKGVQAQDVSPTPAAHHQTIARVVFADRQRCSGSRGVSLNV